MSSDLRPQGIPDTAWWDPELGHWLHGPLDASGTPDGLWSFWDMEGRLIERTEFAAGQRHGLAWCGVTPGLFLLEDVVAARGRFENERPVGRWALLDAVGNVVEELDYASAG